MAAPPGETPAIASEAFSAAALQRRDLVEVALPVRRSAAEPARGAIVFGVSKRLPFDDAYRAFFEAVAREISANLAAAQELAAHHEAERERQNLYDFFMQTPVPLVILTGQQHRFSLANGAYLELVGLGSRDVMGKTLKEVFPAETVDAYLKLLDHVYLTGEPFWGRELPLNLAGRAELLIKRRLHAAADAGRQGEGRARLRLRRHSRGERKLSLNCKPVELAALVNDVLDRFEPQLTAVRSRVERRLEAGLTGSWDGYRLEQVLTNLFTNAMKYAPGKLVEVAAFRREDQAMLTVGDRGPGVAAKDRERIFGRFERATNPNEVSGLGLGLFISRQIVEAHGGTLRAEDWKGGGTLFVVELPLLR